MSLRYKILAAVIGINVVILFATFAENPELDSFENLPEISTVMIAEEIVVSDPAPCRCGHGRISELPITTIQIPEEDLQAFESITGAIEIGRHPGVVQVTFRAPLDKLERKGLRSFVRDQYGI